METVEMIRQAHSDKVKQIYELKEPRGGRYLDEPCDKPFLSEAFVIGNVPVDLNQIREYKSALMILRNDYFLKDITMYHKLDKEFNDVIEFLRQESKKILPSE
jgi:hypothetical protein